ncbi:MAG TPA: hypothetical protein VFV57_05985 [Limnobacter sp.]|nr:hypothetical protein [Limnobacter sp.]
MALLLKNNAYSRLAASISDVANSLTVTTGHGDRFPIATGGNYFKITLQDAANNIEIIRVTARNSASDTMTILRGQEGTTARAWNLGDIVECRFTAGIMGPLTVFDEESTAAGIRGKIDVPTRTGGDASGLWNISVSGNAATATVLQTARNINGVSFNGSSDITVTANTTNSVTFNNGGGGGASGSSFNGGGALTVSYNTVGAPSTTGANASGTWGINITGNAGTVTNGVYLNGTQTITGIKDFTSSNTGIANSAGNLATLEAYGSGGAAFMAFHRPGQYAAYFGLDSDNQWKVGGWSMGAVAYPILHSANYNSYAPTLTGGGASGTWGINITGNAESVTNGVYNNGATYGISISGNAATATTATRSNALNVLDTRSVVQGPGGLGQVVRADFLNNSTDGLNDGGTHHGVLTFNQWTDASGGGTRQLGFTDNDNLWLRGSGSGQTSYGPWKLMLNSLNYNAYAPTLTGGGASGTWGINITGNAGSAYGLGVQGAGSAPGANQVLRSDGNGYTYHNYINSNTGNGENPPINQVIVTNGSDNFYRKASIAHLGNQLNANGYQFVAQTGGSPAYYGARAWVNFNGQGTVAIRAQANVSSITDLGLGYYRVNFSTGMPDANYVVDGLASVSASTGGSRASLFCFAKNDGANGRAAPLTSSFEFITVRDDGGVYLDPIDVCVAVFR